MYFFQPLHLRPPLDSPFQHSGLQPSDIPACTVSIYLHACTKTFPGENSVTDLGLFTFPGENSVTVTSDKGLKSQCCTGILLMTSIAVLTSVKLVIDVINGVYYLLEFANFFISWACRFVR
jgi:hypothetical protein